MRFDGVAGATRRALSRPALVLWCGLIALFDAATLVLLLFAALGRDPLVVLGLLAVQRLLVVGVLAFFLPGCYAIYRNRSAGDGEDGVGFVASLRTAVGATRSGTPRLLGASLVTRAVALPAALALAVLIGALFLGVDTVAVWSAAVLGAPVDREILALAGVFLSLAGGAWLVNGAVAYQDLLALDGEAGLPDAWWESLAATTARPAWLVGQGLFRGLLLALPWVTGGAALVALGALTTPPVSDTVGLAIVIASAVVFLVVAAVARATIVASHVDTYEERIRPAVAAGDRPIVANPRRVAVAAAVVLAAVAGVAMVRTADVAPGPDVPYAEIQPSNTEATVSTAVSRTLRRDYAFAFAESSYNRSTGTWHTVFDGSGRIDRDAPEATITIALHFDEGSVQRRTFYAADGIYALRVPTGEIRTHGLLEREVRTGNWTAAIGRPFGATARDLLVLPRGDTNWTRVASDGETVTYAVSDLDELGEVALAIRPPDPADPDIEYLEGTGARVVVDRDTATVRRFAVTAHFREHYDEDDPRVIRRRTTMIITAVGDVSVDRPDGLAGPGPIERVWDVVFYG